MQNKRTQWEFIILGCMYIGYMGFILCRTAISVASPAMIDDKSLELTKTTFGHILGWGTAGMVTGKLLTGTIADRLGGRAVFILALTITAISGFVLSFGNSYAFFAALNFCMLFAAAAGWPAMANIISSWYTPGKYGRVWGIISTSSRLSSVLSTIFLGHLLAFFVWRKLFWIAGGIAILIVLLIFVYLKARPQDLGLTSAKQEALLQQEQEQSDEKSQEEAHPLDDKDLSQALWAFALSGRFWLMSISLMCTTVLMEFIGFLPLYLKESLKLSPAQASSSSSIFPTGCLIALIAGGFIYDKVSRKGRIGLLGGLLFASSLCIIALWMLPNFEMESSTRFFFAMSALFLFGLTVAPAYYLPMSIFSVEFGGKHCGVLIGIIDAMGYGASMSYQFTGGALVEKPGGWQNMLILLLTVSVVATVITIWFTIQDYICCKE